MALAETVANIAIYLGLFTLILFLVTFFEQRRELKNPKITKYYNVDILIPAYNEEESIERTIQSVLNLDYPKNKLKIVVIDDGSTDNTYMLAKKFEKQGVIVYTKENGGKASALNYAIKRSNAEIIFSLDADSFVGKENLNRMIGYFDNPYVMAVTPALKIDGKGNWLQKVQRVEYLWGVFLRKVFAMLGSIHVTPGPFTGYRKTFFDKYGGDDEKTLTEDIELALRIQGKNYVIENCMDASVYTIGPKTFKGLFNQRLRWYKGFLDNTIKHKYLFSYKYGHLGLFVLPISFIFIGILLFSTFLTLYNLGTDIYKTFFNLNAINFNFFGVWQFDLFNLYIPPFLILGLFLLIIAYLVIAIAKKVSEDNTNIKFDYLLYIILYWNLLAFWWFMAIIYKLGSINVRWAK